MKRKVLTKKHKQFIRDNYLKMSQKKICDAIGFARSSVYRFMKSEELSVPKELRDKWTKESQPILCSESDDKYIKTHYLEKSIKQIGRDLKMSPGVISRRIKSLELIIPEGILNDRIKNSQFNKGNISYNKGLKQSDYLTPEQIEKAKKTWFKKGSTPTNKEEIGYIGSRNDTKTGLTYLWIKIRDIKGAHTSENYQELHRYNWEQKNGPIPKKGIIAFIDGDTLNPDIDNLELITMKENMIRNSGYINLPDNYVAHLICGKNKDLRPYVMQQPNLLELKRASINLNKEINEQSKR